MSSIKIELTSSEALVLVDFLIRYRDNETIDKIEDAEQQMLWDMCAMLESQVPELLDSNYKELLEKARKVVISGDEIN
jgi:hypothetical protein